MNMTNLSSGFSKKLNVDAPEFVPSFIQRQQQQATAASVPGPQQQSNNNVSTTVPTYQPSESTTSSSATTAQPSSTMKHTIITKEHLNIVFIGHVDAGKSTIGGQLLYLTGMVDKRTLEKYEREAKEKNRESWYLSWALDTNQEERDKGKTVEVGRAYFETENKHFTLLDAPGHRGFVPNMIGGACQADVAVLVISARKGEFETGFERGGQTREHAMLAKTAGVKHLIVLINKMDDPTVEWSETRYQESFLRDVVDEKTCSWYRGPSFLDYLDKLPSFKRQIEGPFRMPIVDKYKDMGTVVFGKIESGSTERGAQLLLMPNRKPVEVLQLWSDEDEVSHVSSGENVKIKLKGVEEEEVTAGFVLCDLNDPCATGRIFDAQVAILEHKSIICPGYSAVLHINSAIEEVCVKNIIDLIDKKTGQRCKVKPRFVKQDQLALMRLECTGGMVCMEPFSKFQQMGRFTLRDEGKTIAIGKVLRIVE
ncbi:eukaryotic peptide chain release factor gtp-binding subunit-like protein [Dermatophagoides farinae]|uniref:Eukaryotic peptide chain release factor gtp-binding subunit-like protein n=1 Tax=Dermatophagoides farinae TaxID=6954 RepID=A0A9D4SHN6_DERFA|nr:eukaryotic peptide chain release factor gtp-binding subunit-like protein [Dermatophagoides farinae]